MIKVDARDFASVRQQLAMQGKQAAFAASRALNTAAFAAMRDGRQRMVEAFDRPTTWTTSAWRVRDKASKDKLSVTVGWSDYLANKSGNAAEFYLGQHFSGGRRNFTAFENRLKRGGVLPEGMNAVPGKAAHELGMIDGRGNMKAGVLVAILSALRVLSGPGHHGNAAGRKQWSANKRAAAQVYWAGKPGPNTPNGIWAIDENFRKGRGRLRPVMVFVSRANYRKRLDLRSIADRAIRGTFLTEFDKELTNALKTAR